MIHRSVTIMFDFFSQRSAPQNRLRSADTLLGTRVSDFYPFWIFFSAILKIADVQESILKTFARILCGMDDTGVPNTTGPNVRGPMSEGLQFRKLEKFKFEGTK